jgi:hypothetical protein
MDGQRDKNPLGSKNLRYSVKERAQLKLHIRLSKKLPTSSTQAPHSIIKELKNSNLDHELWVFVGFDLQGLFCFGCLVGFDLQFCLVLGACCYSCAVLFFCHYDWHSTTNNMVICTKMYNQLQLEFTQLSVSV